MTASQLAAERAARTSYGRLLALLAARSGDITEAEDALADAFERALTHWPSAGVPDNPDAWLLSVARNRLKDHWKSAAHRRTAAHDPGDLAEVASSHNSGGSDDPELDALPDRRLELLLVCAHPAIDRAMHTPLMLNTVLGCTAEQIGRAFAQPTATLASRLVRAKRRIAQARIPFRLPDSSVLRPRLDAVLHAIYGAYAIDWSTGTALRDSLSGEAQYLAALAAELTGDSEAHGLAAMISFGRSRAAARRTADGKFVPLAEQDPQLWDAKLIQQGKVHLRMAHDQVTTGGQLGRYQLEAAIQALHCARTTDHPTDWMVLVPLHQSLYALAPGLGTATALAAATAERDGPDAGLATLERLLTDLVDSGAVTEKQCRRFQPAWVTRAHLLARLDRCTEAVPAADTALELTHDPAERSYLTACRTQWASRPLPGQ